MSVVLVQRFVLCFIELQRDDGTFTESVPFWVVVRVDQRVVSYLTFLD